MIRHYPDVCGTPHRPEAADVVTLETLDDWHAFVDANLEALMGVYGSLSKAFIVALDGELVLGGGAAPLVHVVFLND